MRGGRTIKIEEKPDAFQRNAARRVTGTGHLGIV